MALILNIDTAVDFASLCLAKDGKALPMANNESQKDHASWYIWPSTKFSIKEVGGGSVEAIAVTVSPGSYTVLRIGMSTAKGVCFALNIPLIS